MIENLTMETLNKVLKEAHFTLETDSDGDLYISEGLEFPVWLNIDEDHNVLKVLTVASLIEDADEFLSLQLANRINTNFFPNTVSVQNGKLYSFYYVFLEDKIAEQNLIKILRHCSSAFVNAVREEDTDDLIG